MSVGETGVIFDKYCEYPGRPSLQRTHGPAVDTEEPHSSSLHGYSCSHAIVSAELLALLALHMLSLIDI